MLVGVIVAVTAVAVDPVGVAVGDGGVTVGGLEVAGEVGVADWVVSVVGTGGFEAVGAEVSRRETWVARISAVAVGAGGWMGKGKLQPVMINDSSKIDARLLR